MKTKRSPHDTKEENNHIYIPLETRTWSFLIKILPDMGYYKRFVNSPHLQPHNLINLKPSLSPPKLHFSPFSFLPIEPWKKLPPTYYKELKTFKQHPSLSPTHYYSFLLFLLYLKLEHQKAATSSKSWIFFIATTTRILELSLLYKTNPKYHILSQTFYFNILLSVSNKTTLI